MKNKINYSLNEHGKYMQNELYSAYYCDKIIDKYIIPTAIILILGTFIYIFYFFIK